VADPIQMLYNLLTDPDDGIVITADDGSSQMGPNIGTPPTVDVKIHPYQQEDETQIPLVVIGPRTLATAQPLVGLSWTEIHETIEIRVVTRTWDGGDFGFTSEGNSARNKLLENVRSIVKSAKSNPDGAYNFVYMRVIDPGTRNPDMPEGVPLYKTSMGVEVVWLE